MPRTRLAAALAVTAALTLGTTACSFLGDPDGGDEVTHTADAFLSAWQADDIDEAARLTTDPARARTELLAYREQTDVTSVTLSPGHADGSDVPFRAVATIDLDGTRATWNYTSRLTVVTDDADGKPRVFWHSSVIHPALPDGGGYTLVPFARSGPATLAYSDGTPLSADDHPGLRQIVEQVQHRYADSGHRQLGIRLSAEGDGGGGRVVTTLDSGATAHVRTRFDASAQKAVDRAVAGHPGASVVVVRPSTGDVLAAFTTGDDFDPALEGVQAPGQVFELVTTAALLDHGLATPETAVGCPADIASDGATFTNPDGRHVTDATLTDVFTHSCDTGYVKLASKLTGAQLAGTARDVFGLGLDWRTGVTTADGAVPVLDGRDRTLAAIGQGEVRLNILDLASVTATVRNGTFKQPLFVDTKTIGKAPARAPHPLPGSVAADLRKLMSAYAHRAGIDGGAFGGVADQQHDDPAPVVGWFTAYDGDLAVAATAPERTHTPEDAEAVVRAVLDATTG